jgi:hypothetical protein
MTFRISKSRFVTAALVLAAACFALAAYVRVSARAAKVGPATELPTATVKSDVVPGDNCPTLTSWVVSPIQTSVGAWIDVRAAATDDDPGEAVTYSWAPAEKFEAPGQATTRYRCAFPGKQAILLKVTDDHSPMTCSTWFRIVVDCKAG